MDDTNPENELGLIWGSPAIAQAIGRKQRITAYMLEKGEIPGAKIVSGQWVISRHKLREFFGLEAA
ncbi:DNA-binding protein [Mesorhizobium sp. CA18]|uniref:DNA-binding protein n=1 Tax=unclassified Mesorhizobium TaxID=325217 RepID=UPI001CCF0559|nr:MULTISPECIES: DNA-binding protein [unclassified Mesorhizobium]MBZ9736178.1 DNA-binding protein [Mesorhizobium sp. CA9]MBZ9826430.1 DNA-binding protein [Mesorhizobium sp. CA18]MBZ9831553.1 DNA-binding protein [Mesorhizobium sp. CA2]MBZ9837934.1 DNA-binding protein [Mesorhizobium sp. CA3]MBZ9878540.1 DNA-binding protein [Mesorhizobium sp. Ca11]